jgi:rRNA processing protein Gar1
MTERKQVVARRGDVVAVTAHHLGERERIGEILEVLGDASHPHFRVRWEDDRETIFYPSNDSVIRRRKR